MLLQLHSCILIANAWEKDLSMKERKHKRERKREKKSIATPGVTAAVIALSHRVHTFLSNAIKKKSSHFCLD